MSPIKQDDAQQHLITRLTCDLKKLEKRAHSGERGLDKEIESLKAKIAKLIAYKQKRDQL